MITVTSRETLGVVPQKENNESTIYVFSNG
jgi:hypothetical protein